MYEINMTVFIKTMRPISRMQMLNEISDALWKSPKFRDIQIVEFDSPDLQEEKIGIGMINLIDEIKSEFKPTEE